MNDPQLGDSVSRRDFLCTAGAGAALALTAGGLPAADTASLPHKVLGRTNVRVPILGLGTAPAGYRSEKEAVAFYQHCVDQGLAVRPVDDLDQRVRPSAEHHAPHPGGCSVRELVAVSARDAY